MSAAIFSFRQRGIAIITALLVVAMVAALAMTLAARTGLWLNQVQNRQDFVSAQVMARGAIDLARLTLRDDARKNQVDHLQEAWAIPIPAINAEAGKVGGRIMDVQGLFNLANLLKNGQLDQESIAGLKRLFPLLGVDAKLADRLQDYLQQALERQGEAEVAPFFPFVDLSELMDVPGFDAVVIDRLKTALVVLPKPSSVNVNFVSPEVLVALMPGLSMSDAGSVISARSGTHFATVNAFAAALPDTMSGTLGRGLYSVTSQYFLAEIDTWFGRVHMRHQALLARDGNQIPDVVWVRRIYGRSAF